MFYFKLISAKELTARNLALSLLAARKGASLPVGNLIAGAALFDIDAAAMRMAVTRLTKDGLMESPDRGVYKIGPKAQAFSDATQAWRYALEKTRPWDGGWLAVHTAQLGRTDKKRLRAREQALRLFGFAQSVGGLWVRPGNLVQNLPDISEALFRLGLEENAVLINANAHIAPVNWESLWARADLEKTYDAAIAAMEQSERAVESMTLSEAARETLLVGQSVIRTINLDPLLPEGMVDRALFEKMVRKMMEYDALGHRFWRHFTEEV